MSAFLRPHFLTRRQYESLQKGGEALWTAIDRMRQMVLSTPALLNRLDLLPGERMLAEMNPGYKHFAVTSLLDSHINNGSMRVSRYRTSMSGARVRPWPCGARTSPIRIIPIPGSTSGRVVLPGSSMQSPAPTGSTCGSTSSGRKRR